MKEDDDLRTFSFGEEQKVLIHLTELAQAYGEKVGKPWHEVAAIEFNPEL